MASPQVTPNQDRWAQYAETPETGSKHVKNGDKWDEFSETPDSQPKSDTSVISTLGRELKSGYQSVKSLVPETLGGSGAIYHAAADPMTQEEKARDFPDGSEPVGPIGRGIYRMAIAPVSRASEYWYDKAKGNIPSEPGYLPDSSTLAVAPEAMGGGAAAVVAGEVAPKIPGALKAVPRLASGVSRAIPAIRAGAAGALDFASKAVDPDLLGLVSPRAAHAVRYAGKVGNAIRPGPFKYSSPAGPPMESGAFEPLDGEYLPPDAPKGLSAGIRRSTVDASFPQPEPSAPYRYGPGEIPVEDVAKPDPFTLGRRQGVRVQPQGPMKSLPAAPPEAETFGVSPSRQVSPDVEADTDWQQIMREDLANHGVRARREASANFREGNDVSKPKWELQAEAKADIERQRILDEARRTHDNPLKGLPPVTSRVKSAPAGEAPVSTPDSEILGRLKESVKKAKADKGKR